jgi:hypothetical protein
VSDVMRMTGSVLALLAACAVLFGASFAAARLAREDDRERVAPPSELPAVLADTELALGPSAPDLPGLRRKPRPDTTASAGAASAPVAAAPAPAAPPEPERQRVSNPSPKPRSGPRRSTESPSNPSPPSGGAPAEPSEPASELPPEVEFYDSGG